MTTGQPGNVFTGLVHGGYKLVKNSLYQGVVLDSLDDTLWVCKHLHSRPEYNSRHPHVPQNIVWEYSALNCGRTAAAEWPNPVGRWGPIGDSNSDIEQRADTRKVKVGNDSFIGQVKLNDHGYRILRVTPEGDKSVQLSINIDLPFSKGVTLPKVSDQNLEAIVTAGWLLTGSLWGLVFQDEETIVVDHPSDTAIQQLLGRGSDAEDVSRLSIPVADDTDSKTDSKDSDTTDKTDSSDTPENVSEKLSPKETQPHIRPTQRDGVRVYEVIGWHDDVVSTYTHRGKAAKRLATIKRKK